MSRDIKKIFEMQTDCGFILIYNVYLDLLHQNRNLILEQANPRQYQDRETFDVRQIVPLSDIQSLNLKS